MTSGQLGRAKSGYDTAHKALNSKVETVVDDFMTMDLEPLGTFDVVFFLGVLYHMENPLASLRRVASLTNGLAIIETHAIIVAGFEHLELCEFYSSNQLNGDVSNWWGPNLKALEGMCRAAGFARVEVEPRSGYIDPLHPKSSLYRKTRRQWVTYCESSTAAGVSGRGISEPLCTPGSNVSFVRVRPIASASAGEQQGGAPQAL